jgi:hypothetical protein
MCCNVPPRSCSAITLNASASLINPREYAPMNEPMASLLTLAIDSHSRVEHAEGRRVFGIRSTPVFSSLSGARL